MGKVIQWRGIHRDPLDLRVSVVSTQPCLRVLWLWHCKVHYSSCLFCSWLLQHGFWKIAYFEGPTCVECDLHNLHNDVLPLHDCSHRTIQTLANDFVNNRMPVCFRRDMLLFNNQKRQVRYRFGFCSIWMYSHRTFEHSNIAQIYLALTYVHICRRCCILLFEFQKPRHNDDLEHFTNRLLLFGEKYFAFNRIISQRVVDSKSAQCGSHPIRRIVILCIPVLYHNNNNTELLSSNEEGRSGEDNFRTCVSPIVSKILFVQTSGVLGFWGFGVLGSGRGGRWG